MLSLKSPKREKGSDEPRAGLGGALAGISRPVCPADDAEEVAEPRRGIFARLRRAGGGGDPEGLTTTWSSGNVLGTKVAGGVVIALLLSGPLHWGYDAFVAEAPAPVVQQDRGQDQRALSRRMVASESAVQWVQTWATATEETRDLLGDHWSGSNVTLPVKASKISGARVVDAQASAPGVWSVTVTAEVTDPGEEPTRRYYQVPVQVSGDEPGEVSAAPQAIPAIVPGPSATTKVDRGSYSGSVSMTSAAGQTITQFLAALLAGQGQVDRYITPGADITALPESAQYASVQVSNIRSADAGDVDWQNAAGDGTTVEVVVDATVATGEDAKTRRSVSYPLLLTARGGRWEVTAIQSRLADSSSSAEEEGNTGGPPADPATTGENP